MSDAKALRPLLLLALDGATFDVIHPMIARGELPNLGRWMREGTQQPLRSVVPPVTFPAWSSFATGLEPGEHGVFDFTHKVPGAYRVRFVNATDRAGESLFARIGRAGGRVLVLGLPATFPPEKVNGLLVSGFDAPVSTGTDPRSASDPALYEQIAASAGPWMRPDLDESAREGDFHERAVGTLLERIDRKTAFALEALRALRARDGGRPDLLMVVFSESDTVGHHYWRDHDPASPRHDPSAGPRRRRAIEDVYARLDRACGELRRAYGEDATCVVLSDHGMGGAARRVVHLNRFLEQEGLLVRRGAGGLRARALREQALRWLPPALAQAIFRRVRPAAARLESAVRFGGIDWSRTVAFSEEANTLPGIWINVRGREAAGCVAPEDRDAICEQLVERLLKWRSPEGAPVVARAWRREELYRGPYVERAPDVVLELGREDGYGLSLVPTPWGRAEPPALRTLSHDEWGGGRGRGMNGTHRPDGIWIAHGGEPLRCERLVDVAATALGAMGVDAPAAPPRASRPEPYDEDDDARVAARLRALGYLE